MSAAPLTAAAIISYCQRLEDRSAAFYDDLVARFPEQARLFAGYAKDCVKHKAQITRTYQETVTDALETNFSFKGLQLPAESGDVSLSTDANLEAATSAALELETKAIAFYEGVAASSEGLLATIPRAFRRVATRRQRRAEGLRALV